jgi:hypothetical protein
MLLIYLKILKLINILNKIFKFKNINSFMKL